MTIPMKRPVFEHSDDPAVLAANAKAVADYTTSAAEAKNNETSAKLDEKQHLVDKTLGQMESDVNGVVKDPVEFNLYDILTGWFPGDVAGAKKEVVARSAVKLNSMSAATWGNISDSVRNAMINSAGTKAAGQAKLVVAQTLDQVTGVANNVANDGDIKADEIEKKASEILNSWQKNANMAAFLFNRFYKKLENRVLSHQSRLETAGEELAKNSVLLQTVYAALQAREQITLQALYTTCVFGIALSGSNEFKVQGIIPREEAELKRLEQDLAEAQGAARGQKNIEVTRQRDFVNLLNKRLIDLKMIAVRLQGFYGSLGTVEDGVAVVEADVEFGRTDIVGMLGMQLNLICEIAATLRVNKAAQNMRQADAHAAEQVGVATDALQQATSETLLNIETGMRALEATIQATIKGAEYSKSNYQKMFELVHSTDARLLEAMEKIGNA